MPKENSLTIRVCDFISKYSIYTLVFLLPVFFLPWTSDILDFNKQALLLFLVSLSLFAWMLKTLILKELTINLNKTYIFVVVLFFVYLLSTIFSLWRYGSFWGWPQVISESLVSLLGLVVFYFLITNLFDKKEISRLILLLVFSGSLALFIGFLQILGLFLLPFSFAKTTIFNTIGTVGSLGFFIIVLLPLIITLLTSKKSVSFILLVVVIFTLAILVILNYLILWWLTIIASVLIMVFGIQKKDLFDSRWLIFPMFFLVLSLFFIVLKPTIGGISGPIEFSLNQKTSFDIDLQTLKEGPVLGSGPGTFGYDFMKYKNIDFNKNLFWNVGFNGTVSKILTVLATIGILGALALLSLMACVLFYGIKFFFIDKSKDDSYWNMSLSVFVGFIVLSVGFFLRNSNLTLDFLYFFLIAAFIALVSEERKKYTLEPSSLMTIGITFVFTLVFIFGFGLLILIGQKYIAEVNYNRGLAQLQNGERDAGIKSTEKAVGFNPDSDLYLRQLSQLYLFKIGQEVARTDISQEEKNKNAQILINNAVNSSVMASNINPKNANNWSTRGFVYQNLIGIIPDTENWAIKSYDEAQKLDPSNPYYPTQKGIVFLTQALLLPKEKENDRSAIFSQAEEQLEKAIQLKSDYASAHFQIAMLYQAEGKTAEAIKRLEDTKKYASQDIGLAFQLGLLYYQNKDWQLAQREFEWAVGIAPDYSNALYFLGLTYYELGQKDKAIEKIQKVLELNPDNETVKKVLDNIKTGKKPLEEIGQQAPIEEKPK